MKRFTTFVALFVCTMIISGSVVQLRAQGPTAVGGGALLPMMPCIPDCPETPFPPTRMAATFEIAGCTVEVDYRTRRACDLYYDVFIDQVRTINGRNEANDPACDALFSRNSSAAILAEATRELLRLNPMKYPPENKGECEVNWRVVKGGCWSRPYIHNGSLDQELTRPTPSYFVNRLVPCPTEEVCCVDRFVVCLIDDGTTNGKRVVTAQPPEKSKTMPSCAASQIDSDNTSGTTYRSCDPVCGVAPPLSPSGND
jgi:hypothetical protein